MYRDLSRSRAERRLLASKSLRLSDCYGCQWWLGSRAARLQGLALSLSLAGVTGCPESPWASLLSPEIFRERAGIELCGRRYGVAATLSFSLFGTAQKKWEAGCVSLPPIWWAYCYLLDQAASFLATSGHGFRLFATT